MLIRDGAIYSSETPQAVVDALEIAKAEKYRVRLWFGDPVTGKSWEVETDHIGYVSHCQWGIAVFPCLVHNSRADTGPRIPAQYIVKIAVDSVVLYKHPTFSQPAYRVMGNQIIRDGEHWREAETEDQAERIVDYMLGKRGGVGGGRPK